MKKRKNTLPSDADAEAASDLTIAAGSAAPLGETAPESSTATFLNADRAPAASLETADPPSNPKGAGGANERPAHNEPVLPRAAMVGPATRPELPPAVSVAEAPPSRARERQPRRFALLAACVAISAGLGAVIGSLAEAELNRMLAAAAPASPPRLDTAEDLRALKDSVAQLRGTFKTLGDGVTAIRTGLNASFASSTGQLSKISDAIEKLEHHQVERQRSAAVAVPPAGPETTGSISSGSAKPAAPAIVEGWVVRRAMRGAALVEGRYGIIEIEPGDHVPGVGRVEDIKRQDGRWVVVTAKGLIIPAQ